MAGEAAGACPHLQRRAAQGLPRGTNDSQRQGLDANCRGDWRAVPGLYEAAVLGDPLDAAWKGRNRSGAHPPVFFMILLLQSLMRYSPVSTL